MVEVSRKKGETAESMLRRFSRRIRQSGVLVRAKKGRYHAPKMSKGQRQQDTLRKLRASEQREYLLKIGKLEEELPYMQRRRRKTPSDQTLPSSKENN